jgi:hypothetical protein
LAVALLAVGGAWLGIGIAGAQSGGPAARPTSGEAASTVALYGEMRAAADNPPPPVSATTIDELQIGVGGGTMLLVVRRGGETEVTQHGSYRFVPLL